MITIKLLRNNAYKWYQKDGIFVKGYLFSETGKLFTGAQLIDYFLDVFNGDELQKKLEDANGIFSVVIRRNNTIFAAVDSVRTFPLFYVNKDGRFLITDDIEASQESKLDKRALDEMFHIGYTLGKKTINKDIFQIEASSSIFYNKPYVRSKVYFDYIKSSHNVENLNEYSKTLLRIFDRMTQRLLEFVAGRRIVLPLSGGYDSRLIAVLLKKYNYKNVLCFTYGNKHSDEISISQKVAKSLGFEWHVFNHNSKTIPKDMLQDEEYVAYIKYAFNGVSVSHVQDYFAVRELMKSGVLNKDDVIVPGHSADFLAGSHTWKTPISNSKNIVDNIMLKHCNLNKPHINPETLKNIKDEIHSSVSNLKVSEKNYYSVDDNWNMKERQAKFIINSLRAYDFFNIKYAIPLWDKELVEFFRDIPLIYKKKKGNLYLNVIMRFLFISYGVGFKKKENYVHAHLNKLPKIKKVIKYLLKEKLKIIKQNNNMWELASVFIARYNNAQYNNLNCLVAYFIKDTLVINKDDAS